MWHDLIWCDCIGILVEGGLRADHAWKDGGKAVALADVLAVEEAQRLHALEWAGGRGLGGEEARSGESAVEGVRSPAADSRLAVEADAAAAAGGDGGACAVAVNGGDAAVGAAAAAEEEVVGAEKTEEGVEGASRRQDDDGTREVWKPFRRLVHAVRGGLSN